MRGSYFSQFDLPFIYLLLNKQFKEKCVYTAVHHWHECQMSVPCVSDSRQRAGFLDQLHSSYGFTELPPPIISPRHAPHPAGNASDGLPCYSYRIIESCHFVYTQVTPRGVADFCFVPNFILWIN